MSVATHMRSIVRSATLLGFFLVSSQWSDALAIDFVTITIEGTVGFRSNFEQDGTGQVPDDGYAVMPYIFVCAYDRNDGSGSSTDSQNDAQIIFGGGTPKSADTLLGCDTADVDGFYRVSLVKVSPVSDSNDLYLVTYLCDGPDGGQNLSYGSNAAATVCARRDILKGPGETGRDADAIDVADGNGTTAFSLARTPLSRKVIWSTTYNNGVNTSGQVTTVSWNLSCPNTSGLGATSVSCSPTDLGHSSNDNANSNSGYNASALHVYRAAIETRKSNREVKPDAGNTVGTDNGGQTRCSADRCLDEINLHVADDSSANNYCREKLTAGDNSHMQSFDRVCIVTTRNPFRIVHEIGHNIQRRWMVMPENTNLGAGDGSSSWQGSTCQKQTLAEGWANFYSAAAWFNGDDANPEYSGSDIEDPEDTALYTSGNEAASCTAAQGEGRGAQFFWDVYDTNNHANEEDGVSVIFSRIQRIFSMFRPGTGSCVDGSNNEGGPHGRNIRDWFDNYNRYRTERPDLSLPALDDVLADNCMDNGNNASSSLQCGNGETYTCP